MNLIPLPLILQCSLQQYFLTTHVMSGVDGASIPHFWDRLHDFYPKKKVNFCLFSGFFWHTQTWFSFFQFLVPFSKSFHFEVLIESTSYHHLIVHISYNHLLAK
jgi:hypothetical protein